ncbi:MAG: glycosyltransferase family 4 protein [Cryomorphaceae bacterium]|nr:glycosyltransferase family 4 protein [Cryomorphaceae bacterium]
MKVIHVSGQHHWRGGEQQLYLLFCGLQDLGVQQELLCPKDSALHLRWQMESLPFSVAKKCCGFDFRFIRSIARLAKAHPKAIIHLHDSHAHQMALISAEIFRFKNAMVLHRRVIFKVGTGMLSKWKYHHPLIRIIVAVSKAVAGSLPETLSNKIQIVYSAVNPPSEDEGKNWPPEGVHLPSNAVVWGMVGALSPEKGQHNAIQALSKSNSHNSHLVLIGAGKFESELRELAKDLKVSSRVHFTGFLPFATRYIRNFDVFLFPSESEGLGTSIMDAMWRRVVVVASNVGGIPELIRHGETGFLYENGDINSFVQQIEIAINNRELKTQITENAFQFIQAFSPKSMCNKMLDVYRDLH